MIKNLVICENLKLPPDEGASKLAVEFIKSLDSDTHIINFGEKIKIGGIKARAISYRQMPILGFIFSRFVSFFYIIKMRPYNIYYFPLCSPNIINQVYASILNILAPSFKEVLFQKNDFKFPLNFLSRFKIALFSRSSADILSKMGLHTEYIFISHIKPDKIYDKTKIREKYGIKQNAFVALHVGHAEAGRGMDVLSELQNIMPDIQVTIVLSSRKQIKKEDFINPKIKIINKYIEDIYEIFSAADVYLFPIKTNKSAIDVPLSIIEAKEANLPVIASDVGSIKESLEGYSKGYLIKVQDKNKMAENIKKIIKEIIKEKK